VLTPMSAQAQTAQAQTTSPKKGNNPNIDDVPSDPTQLRTWRCSQGDRAVVVEAKDLRWKPTIETNGWSCLEELSPIATNRQQFSCEPDESLLGIITVTWLQGKEAKKQMRAWLNEFSANPTLVCTVDKTNPFWQ
jgi:hypothetical protein